MGDLIPYSEIEKMAAITARSGLFGVKTIEQAAALMLIAQAEGLHPAIAARDYHIIEGRPSLKADAMLARFQQAGGKVQFKEYTDKRVCAIFYHPLGDKIEVDWTTERAKQAGLSTRRNKDGSPNMWERYPRQMLRARVISEGIRTIFPGCIGSFFTPEEVMDMDDKPAEINVTPQETSQAIDNAPLPPITPPQRKSEAQANNGGNGSNGNSAELKGKIRSLMAQIQHITSEGESEMLKTFSTFEKEENGVKRLITAKDIDHLMKSDKWAQSTYGRMKEWLKDNTPPPQDIPAEGNEENPFA